MAVYDYLCPACRTVFGVTRPMNEPGPRPCPSCSSQARQTFCPPHFQADTTAQKNYARILGDGPLPQTRADLRRIEKERGIYFDNKLTAREERLRDYARHVKAGGERLPSEVVNPPEAAESKTIKQIMAEKNVTLRP